MVSTRPYLVRAFYEWIVDSDCTPHIVVNADFQEVEVPREFVEGGQIILNISMAAVQELELGNDAITFKARFSGVAHEVFVPVPAVMAIYARENGRGMVFSEEDPPPEDPKDDNNKGSGKGKGGKKGGSKKGSHLKVVK